jgi:hypothetical protein
MSETQDSVVAVEQPLDVPAPAVDNVSIADIPVGNAVEAETKPQEQAQAPAEPSKPKKEAISVAKRLESAKRSLRSDVVLSISGLDDKESKICATSDSAKGVLGDIAFILLKRIIDKAVEISVNIQERKTLNPDIIQVAARTIAPLNITSKGHEEWKEAFDFAKDAKDWAAKILEFEKSVDARREQNQDWKTASKSSKDARLDYGKRKNDFARKQLGLYIRPTLTLRIVKLLVPNEVRAGGLMVGIALSYALSAMFDMLYWAVVDSNGKKTGNWRLSTKATFNGVQASEPLKQILKDLLVAGCPLGLLVNTAAPNQSKKRKLRRSRSKPSKKTSKSGKHQDEDLEDDEFDELSDDDGADSDSDVEMSGSESESEAGSEDDSDSDASDSDVEEEKPKRRSVRGPNKKSHTASKISKGKSKSAPKRGRSRSKKY